MIYMIMQEPLVEEINIKNDTVEIENNNVPEEEIDEVKNQVTVNLNETEIKAFEPVFSISKITEEIYKVIDGVSYIENTSIGLNDLRYLEITHYNFDLEPTYGELICHERVAEEIIEIFKILYEAKYPIEKVKLVDYYNADDDLSMLDNNTHMFNYRVIAGSNTLSNHAYGLAIDINPMQNPYVRGQIVSPLGADQYLDREIEALGMIYKNDVLYNTFISHGWKWGGDWNSLKDYQHFEKIINGVNN